MSEFGSWVRGKIARLDGARERRNVALGSMALLLALLFGPWMLRTVEAVTNAPSLSLQNVPSPAAGPFTLQATASNAVFSAVEFVVTPGGGTAFTVQGSSANPSAVPSVWTSPPIPGQAGQGYSVVAQGNKQPTTVPPQALVTSNTIAFTVATAPTSSTDTASGTGDTTTSGGTSGSGTTGGTSTGTSVTRFAEMVQAQLATPSGNAVSASGVQSDFTPASAFFHVESGTAFNQDFPATRASDGSWRADFTLPPDGSYVVNLVVISDDGLQVNSPGRQVDVPAAASPMTPAAPAVMPSLSILLPLPDASQSGPVSLSARISDATAVGVIFEVSDGEGVVSSLPASPAGDTGVWNALFSGGPGTYTFSVRASLDNGFVQTFTEQRTFGILSAGSPSSGETSPVPGPDAAPAAPTSSSPLPEPTVELLSPPDQAPPFDGSVPLYARVKDGAPDGLVFVVSAADGAETVVLGKVTSDDVWSGSFEGADGGYAVRARADFAGVETFSAQKAFTLKRAPKAAPARAPSPVEAPSAVPPATSKPVAAASVPAAKPVLTPTPTPPPAAPAPAASTSATPVVSSAAVVPADFALECRTAGISQERCDAWLKAKHQPEDCLTTGAVTREDCAALLRRENLPFDGKATYGLASRQEVDLARTEAKAHYDEAVTPDQMPPAIGHLLAFTPQPDERWRLMPPLAVDGATATAPALLTLDRDGDGLPDDVERRLGSDPLDPDSDHDGFTDGAEVKNGYNPIGTGSLALTLRGVDKALVEGMPIEEPRGTDAKVDEDFSIAASTASGTATPTLRLAGKAAPNSVVAVFVYSYLPIVITTTTDADGNWKYDFSGRLADGRHEAYVSVNDDTGKLVAASSPLSFFVKDAQAVSEADFLRPDVNVQAPAASATTWFLIGGGVLVLFALILAGSLARRSRL